MLRYITIHKESGETPLAALQAWKKENPIYKGMPASYAGRLDPMAEGKLLVLIGEECKKQKRYTRLDKEYEIEVLFDVGSDTGDALGLISYAGVETRLDAQKLRLVLAKEIGAHTRTYPVFSSKTVNGKPLFLYALEGTLSDIKIPRHTEHIYRAQLLGIERLNASALHARIDSFLALVPKTDELSKMLGSDFRINDVRASWKELFAKIEERTFYVARLRVTCGSGTYMRSLAPRVGSALGTNALALSIKRIKIGTYIPWLRSWFRQY